MLLTVEEQILTEIISSQNQIRRVLIEELEERLPDPDEGLEVRAEVEQQLLRSLNKPRGSLQTSEEAWKALGLK